MPLKWLITGGCGFIGSNLVLHLLERGHQVRIVDNLSAAGIPDTLDMLVRREVDALDQAGDGEHTLVVGDIRDRQLAAASCQGMDAVVHLAGCTGVLPSVEDPFTDCETNVLGTLNFLDGARRAGCGAFVFASSGAPLGEQIPPIHEEMVGRPISPYGASKLSCEAYCSAYNGSFDLRTICLRFSNVYGAGSRHKDSVVARFIKQALAGETLVIYGDGTQTRDYLYVGDLVRAIVSAVERGGGGEVYQIATQRETPVSWIAEAIQREMAGQDAPPVRIEYQSFRKGEVLKNYSDISKAREALRWEPAKDLQQGIQEVVRWFVKSR